MTVDQAISSASNILFLALAAHVLTLSSFGMFSVIFGTYSLMVGLGRALVSEPLTIKPDDALSRPGVTVSASLMAGLGLGFLVASGGALAWGLGFGDLGAGLAVLAVCLPLLLLQDLGRFIGFASQRPSLAVVLDSAWLSLAVAGAAVLVAIGETSLPIFVATWGGAGVVAGLILFVYVPFVRPSLGWVRENWAYSSQYLMGTIAAQGSALLLLVIAGPIIGTRGLGALRAAVLLSRPFGTFQIAVMSSTTIHVARATELESVRQQVRRATLVVLVVATMMSVFLLLLPDSVGRILIGDAWYAAEPLLVPVCAGMFAAAIFTPARASLLGLKYVATSTRLDIFSAVTSIVASLVGAWLGGVAGALWGVVGVAVLVAALAWGLLLPRLRRHDWTAQPVASGAP